MNDDKDGFVISFVDSDPAQPEFVDSHMPIPFYPEDPAERFPLPEVRSLKGAFYNGQPERNVIRDAFARMMERVGL